MANVILRDLAGEFSICPEEWELYLNRTTAQCVMITHEDQVLHGEMEADASDLPADQVRDHPEEWIRLPSKRDFHEHKVMVEFSRGQADGRLRERLLAALEAKGAFRRFKDTVERLNIDEAWYEFRDRKLAAFLVERLEGRGLSFT